MSIVIRWVSYFVIVIGLTVAPGLIAIGLATSAHAAPTTSSSVHQMFAHQNNGSQPGTPIQHQYQQLH
jgi:hypothetical protein